MGLNVACAVLELGGDVICIDRMEKPLPDLGSSYGLSTDEPRKSDMI